jgi:hypothetical protein
MSADPPSLVQASKKAGDAIIDEKAIPQAYEKGADGQYMTTLSPAELELEKKLKRKIDLRWLILSLIYLLNCS